MKLLVAISIFAAAAVTLEAQTVANTSNVLHPLTKHGRHAISSIDQDPELSAEFSNHQFSGGRRGTASAYGRAEEGKPTEIVAKIDERLAPSDLSIIGTVEGLKCNLAVKNVGSKLITPQITLAVCDYKGVKIGTTVKTGGALMPGASENVNIMATNVDGADLKIQKLIPAPSYTSSDSSDTQ